MSKEMLFERVRNIRGGIDPSKVIQEAIIETAQLPPGTDCRVIFDSDAATYRVVRYWKVVPDKVAHDDTPEEAISINQMTLQEALKRKPNAYIGEVISEEIHFSRIEFQKFKRFFSTEMQKAERSRVTENYRARIGDILIGTVKRQPFTREGTVLEIEDGIEVLLPHEEKIPKEEIRLNDRLYVYLYDVNNHTKGPPLLVSRTAPELLAGLFKLKILEVNSGIIEVKRVARDPGARAKVAVKTNDGRLNPIGTCIGRSGERIKAISNELNEEHIDIILWDENPAQLAIHALAPAEIASITMDEDTHIMDIAVRTKRPEDLGRAIGQSGQNVRLTSQLIGWTINIMSVDEAEQKNREASAEVEELFAEQLGIEPEQAKKLVQNGFSKLEEVASAEEKELTTLLGMEPAQVEMLYTRVNDLLLAKAFAIESESLHTHEVQDESLESLPHMTPELLTALTAHHIDSQSALAELSIDDLLEITPLTRDKAGQLIMSARAYWFKDRETT
jgi:transcription termination/antitermination protein NusA